MNWTRLTRTVAPDPIITVAAAKAHLNVFHDDDDDLIEGLIEAATVSVDGPNGIGVALGSQTWRLSLDGFPCGVIRIPLNPVSEIISIAIDGVALDADEWLADLDQTPAVIYPSVGSWPYVSLQPGRVKITFEAGSDTPPRDLVHAILLLIGHWYQKREGVSDKPLREVPLAVESILARHRVTGLG